MKPFHKSHFGKTGLFLNYNKYWEKFTGSPEEPLSSEPLSIPYIRPSGGTRTPEPPLFFPGRPSRPSGSLMSPSERTAGLDSSLGSPY